MAVVLMVTGAALSVLIYSAKADAVFRDHYRALTACENAAECLRFTNGDSESLKQALENAGFVNPPDDGEENYILEGNDLVVVICVSESEHYVVTYGDETIYTYKKH